MRAIVPVPGFAKVSRNVVSVINNDRDFGEPHKIRKGYSGGVTVRPESFIDPGASPSGKIKSPPGSKETIARMLSFLIAVRHPGPRFVSGSRECLCNFVKQFRNRQRYLLLRYMDLYWQPFV